MPKFAAAIDTQRIPVRGLTPESTATAPTTPVVGQMYTDTSVTPRVVRIWDGSAWVPANLYAGTGSGNYARGDLAEYTSRKNAADGYVGLDASSKMAYSQLPVAGDGVATASTVVQATDLRLSNQRVPTDGSVTGGTAGTGVKIAANTITDANVAAANKDGAAATPSLRTLGTSATSAAAGNDARLSDMRVPTDGSVTGGTAGTGVKIAASTITLANLASSTFDQAAGTASLRTLAVGTGAGNAAMPGTARLDQIVAPTASVSLNTQRITNLAPSQAATDAVNRAELDAARQGYAGAKDPVRVVAPGNVTLTTPGATIDGVTMAVGDRFLAPAQTTALENGIYVWNGAAAAATRATDADAAGEVKDGTTVAVAEGTRAGSVYIQTASVANNAPGSTVAQTWVQFTTQATYIGTADRITVTGTTIDIASTYAGQTSITTLGTIGSGTWQGTAVGVAYGGTGATTAAGARTNLGVAQKGYVETMGAVTAGTAYTITHGLNTQDVIAQVRDASTNEYIYGDIINASATTVTFTSAVAYAANALRVVVLPVS